MTPLKTEFYKVRLLTVLQPYMQVILVQN